METQATGRSKRQTSHDFYKKLYKLTGAGNIVITVGIAHKKQGERKWMETELVPRWLSGWGLVGTAVTIVASCLFMFRVVDLKTSVYMTFPLALQEMVFAVWLIAKGIHSAMPS